MSRPSFTDIKTYSEFCKYYWYREELQEICKSLNIEYVGTKAELNKIIEEYFNGTIILHTPKVILKPKTEIFTLETGIIECGFNFGHKYREFFIGITGDKNFKYTADMVATVKVVKANKDYAFTLGDLLNVKLGKLNYAKYDASSCQWNKFLKDFCADVDNSIYTDKLKIASKYWKLLRDSDLPKVYSKEFIENNKDNIVQ